jgi:CheY-specific phosphatase CheX
MNSPALQFPLREWIDSIVPEVFETMLSLHAVPAPCGESPRSVLGERVSGAIGVAGESLTGAVYLHLSLAFAREITALLLGNAPGDPAQDAEVNDVVGEFCNMVSGKLKSSIANAGVPCAMSPPSIIRGSAFAIEAMPNAQKETFQFDCLNQRLSVEIHLHIQDL